MAQITYSNKTFLNENASIPETNKVTDDNMNEIKSVVNQNDTNVGNLSNLQTTNKTSIVSAINELKKGEIFSLEETITNKIWIDDKPIYRKVVPTGTISNAPKNVAHRISNLGTITELEGFVMTSSGNSYTLPRVVATALNQQIGLSVDSTNITIDAGNSASFIDSFVIIEYTKTTDEVSS